MLVPFELDLNRRQPFQTLGDDGSITRLRKAFVVLDWRGVPGALTTLTTSPKSTQRRWFPHTARDGSSRLSDILSEEGRTDRFVRSICDDIRDSKAYQSGGLGREQILDEIDDRASTYYRRLWDNCSDDEKVVLGHVAQYGLTTAASRRIVRRLLVRRLLTKDPDLRLMNQTFRSFVLSPQAKREVAQLEGVAEPSTWDRLRLPFALAAISAGVFLFTTQRDMFNETVTVLTAVAAAVPTVFRAVAVVVQREAGTAWPPSNV